MDDVMNAWHQTTPWAQTTLWAPFDLETTGVSVEDDRIVTACFGLVNGSDVTTTSWLVNPGIDIPEGATAVHGITTEHAKANGEPAAQAVDSIAGEVAKTLVAGFAVVGMNLAYDLTLLDRETRRHGLPTVEDRVGGSIRPVIDVFVLDKHIDPYRKGSRKLVDLCARYGVRIDGAHDSTFDALAAARIAWRLGRLTQCGHDELRTHGYEPQVCRRLAALGRLTLDELHNKQITWKAEQAAGLGQFWNRKRNQALHEAAQARDAGDDEAMAIAEQEAAELAARIDSLSPHWPLIPYREQEALS
jgi:DNA polymerase III subunit epsilon